MALEGSRVGTSDAKLRLPYPLAVAVVAAAYWLTGRVGLELAYLDGAVAALGSIGGDGHDPHVAHS